MHQLSAECDRINRTLINDSTTAAFCTCSNRVSGVASSDLIGNSDGILSTKVCLLNVNLPVVPISSYPVFRKDFLMILARNSFLVAITFNRYRIRANKLKSVPSGS